MTRTMDFGDQDVDFAEARDFAQHEPFDIRRQVISQKSPALSSDLVKYRIAAAAWPSTKMPRPR